MLLIHARTMVDVRVDLTHIVEITVGDSLRCKQLLYLHTQTQTHAHTMYVQYYDIEKATMTLASSTRL